MINKLHLVVFVSILLVGNSVTADSIYRDNNDGTVTDVLNNLLWQKAENDQMNWENALFYCENLSVTVRSPSSAYSGLAWKTNWRLPNLKELQSLADYATHTPAIDQNHFPGVVSANYWSSTSYAPDSTNAWRVDFYLGRWNFFKKTNSGYFRCVRDIVIDYQQVKDTGQNKCYKEAGSVITCPSPGQPLAQDGSYTINPPTYSDNGDGTVTDNHTGLIWQQTVDETIRDWYGALDYCSDNTADLPGSGWRLPTIEELAGIRDFSKSEPAANSVFNMPGRLRTWSSTTYAALYDHPDKREQAWRVSFFEGLIGHYHKYNSSGTRCVRDGL